MKLLLSMSLQEETKPRNRWNNCENHSNLKLGNRYCKSLKRKQAVGSSMDFVDLSLDLWDLMSGY